MTGQESLEESLFSNMMLQHVSPASAFSSSEMSTSSTFISDASFTIAAVRDAEVGSSSVRAGSINKALAAKGSSLTTGAMLNCPLTVSTWNQSQLASRVLFPM